MEATALKVYVGSVLEKIFHTKHSCIIVNGNSTGVETYGTLKRVYTYYPFSDVISSRRRLYGLERAVRDDRAPVGGVFVRKPLSHPYNEGPSVATIISQFGFGKPIDERERKNANNTSKDLHFVQNLEKDGVEMRIGNFKRCMDSLMKEAIKKENEDINLYLITAGVGRGGLVDCVWLDHYLPIIRDFANTLSLYSIRVVLCISDRHEIPNQIERLDRI